MKYFFLPALLIAMVACSPKKMTTDGLKSRIEDKTGVTFKYGQKTDSTETLYYILNDKDLTNGHGRFDSAKSACISYFNNPGTLQFIMDKAFFKWDKDGFYAVLVAVKDRDSNIVLNLITSAKPIVTDEMHK